ncbi:MAG: hypothetical protein K8L99_25185 [Anaerolineae bacterium]|nr:hypothetical protein [Anaerolineae bacterium]
MAEAFFQRRLRPTQHDKMIIPHDLVVVTPLLDQFLTGGSAPIRLEIGMTLEALTGSIVMAVAAFQGLVAGSMQFAPVIHQESAAVLSELIERKLGLTTLEGGRKHTKREFGSDF